MAKKKITAKSPAKKSAKTKPVAPKKSTPKPAKPPKIVFDEWNSYVTVRGGVTVFVSFDDEVTRGKPPAGLNLCARVVIPIRSPNEAGGPVSPESELLWKMEDKLLAMLKKHGARCRLVARLTFDGWREIVFQVHDWKSFRAPVGLWMMKHKDYAIDVSEHKGWEFFDQYVCPTLEDRLFMADRSVIDSLVESGSDPDKEHALEYAFQGEAKGLKRLAKALLKRGYEPLTELDYDSGTIELVKHLPLDLLRVVEESLANHTLSEKAGVEFSGWGAAVVE